MRRHIINNLKNIVGWHTSRKLVVFCVDDYGNVRLNSNESKQKLISAGLNLKSRFDNFDALETKEDLELLFETLTSVTDMNGNHAVFSAFSMPTNLDFESIIQAEFNQLHFELLNQTFQKLELSQPKAYKGAWELWNEGIETGLIYPQFHGNVHFNKKVISEKLISKDSELLLNIQNKSLAGITDSGYKTIKWTAAFDFWDISENAEYITDIRQGIKDFEKVFGITPTCFTPPATVVHKSLLPVLHENGIKLLDAKTIGINHKGLGKYCYNYNYTGKSIENDLQIVVRNVMFEPTMNYQTNWINSAVDQISAAFKWGKPAVISSHRVNFAGHIDPKNRKIGIEALRLLLKAINNRWPETEFITVNQLNKIMEEQG
jgi:hypothetical protein